MKMKKIYFISITIIFILLALVIYFDYFYIPKPSYFTYVNNDIYAFSVDYSDSNYLTIYAIKDDFKKEKITKFKRNEPSEEITNLTYSDNYLYFISNDDYLNRVDLTKEKYKVEKLDYKLNKYNWYYVYNNYLNYIEGKTIYKCNIKKDYCQSKIVGLDTLNSIETVKVDKENILVTEYPKDTYNINNLKVTLYEGSSEEYHMITSNYLVIDKITYNPDTNITTYYDKHEIKGYKPVTLLGRNYLIIKNEKGYKKYNLRLHKIENFDLDYNPDKEVLWFIY